MNGNRILYALDVPVYFHLTCEFNPLVYDEPATTNQQHPGPIAFRGVLTFRVVLQVRDVVLCARFGHVQNSNDVGQ